MGLIIGVFDLELSALARFILMARPFGQHSNSELCYGHLVACGVLRNSTLQKGGLRARALLL